jgi:hypothetical protein
MANSRNQPVGGTAPEAGEARKQTAAVRPKAGPAKPKAAKPKTTKPKAAKPKTAKPRGAKPRGAKRATPEAKAARPNAAKRKATGTRAKAGVKKAAASAAVKSAPRKPAARKGASSRATAARAGGGRRRRAGGAAVEPPHAVLGLSEEDQIRAAKFLPRELPKRVFEEERFLFPESYGQNRIRLLVRDPEWIFAYWDVKPQSLEELARSLGERALALSRLTLRVVDPLSGGSSDILLPPGARWWYVRTDTARRTYRAELGVTLPSGEFRRLAESNTVVTPRVGPSPEGARRRMSYRDAAEIAPDAAAAAARAEREAGLASEPWAAESVDAARAGAAPGAAASGRAQRGGASDTFTPGGASDVFRR